MTYIDSLLLLKMLIEFVSYSSEHPLTIYKLDGYLIGLLDVDTNCTYICILMAILIAVGYLAISTQLDVIDSLTKLLMMCTNISCIYIVVAYIIWMMKKW